jgi:hypothetical protein
MIACDLVAAFMALLWLKPLAARAVQRSNATAPAVNLSAPEKARTVA